jgi:DNA-binding response OmpR family regulator
VSKILIVDDDVDTCRNLADILSDIGYTSDIAHDGFAALELVRRNAYRVALLDYRMPGMDGLTLCREIRALRADTIAIIVTAYTGLATPDQLLSAGASLILPKPIDVRELVETLCKLCDNPLAPGTS